ncbi:MAG: LysR family transcriptional regulator [Bacteroidia bacterium]
MENFRLKVFLSVAKNLSFTKASNELFISQPAITQHIKELELTYHLRLFERRGSKIILTNAGNILLYYSEKIFSLHRELDLELGAFNQQSSGILRLGASTTIAQYVIPSVLSGFYQNFKKIKLSLQSGNTHVITQAVLKGELDLGIVEGNLKLKELKYEHFISDEVVVVAGSKLKCKSELTFSELIKQPFAFRERGSGTLEVIEFEFKKRKIKPTSLNIVMSLGSTESLKSFLIDSDCLSFMPLRAIKNELFSGLLKVIKVKGFNVYRNFDFIYQQGSSLTGLRKQFIDYAKQQFL